MSAELFEELFKQTEDFIAVSFKRNIDYVDGETDNVDLTEFVSDIVTYLHFSKIDVVASSAGLHLLGENKNPHIHYHAIIRADSISSFNKNQTFISNPSKHRKQYKLLDVSMKTKPLSGKEPKFQFLSYPYKEGRPISNLQGSGVMINVFDGKPMKKEMTDFLLQIGKTLYDEANAKNLIRDKCEERKKESFLELLNLGRTSGQNFKTFRELQIWFEENYIDKLADDEMVDIQNYKKNLQKVAVKLKVCKTYDF